MLDQKSAKYQFFRKTPPIQNWRYSIPVSWIENKNKCIEKKLLSKITVHRPNIKLKPLLWSIQSWSPQT